MTEYSRDVLVGDAQACPCCGKVLNAAFQANRDACEAPEPGDLTVCMGCTQVLVFGSGGTLRRALVAEITPEARQVQRDIRRMQQQLN